MTKKDFELIAGVLRERVETTTPDNVELFADLAAMFADALATTNPRFDRTRFILAATGKDAYDSAGRLVRYS